MTFGIATNVTANVVVISGSGASTRYLGFATNTTFITPAEPTITATVDPTFFVFPNAEHHQQHDADGDDDGRHAGRQLCIISIVVGTNPPAANITPVTNTFTLNVGAVFVPQSSAESGGRKHQLVHGGKLGGERRRRRRPTTCRLLTLASSARRGRWTMWWIQVS